MPGPAYALGSPGRMTMKDVEAPKIRVKLVAEIPEESPEEDAAFALLAQIAGGTKSGRLKRVLEREPAITEALKGMTNVCILPHLGSATVETRIAMGMTVVENLTAFFDGREPPTRVV